MDITKEYIQMCEVAEELQNMHQNFKDNVYSGQDASDRVWLPRQDQLQEMINETVTVQFDILRGITSYRSMQLNSWEKIWLTIVMKYRFSKQWNQETKQWELIK